jgi:hypothetical protein
MGNLRLISPPPYLEVNAIIIHTLPDSYVQQAIEKKIAPSKQVFFLFLPVNEFLTTRSPAARRADSMKGLAHLY